MDDTTPTTPATTVDCDWSSVLHRLERLLGERSVALWLRGSVLRAATSDEFEIGVPNLFVATWIEQRLARSVSEAIAAETGYRPALKFTIDPELFRERRAEQEAVIADDRRLEVTPEALGITAGDAPVARPIVRPALNGVNPECRFETFVIGPANRMAHGAALSVAERPGALYNPLFIYGGCGLGKTHLLQGVAQWLHRERPKSRVLYVSCETFINSFLSALRRKGMAEFRDRFRHYDALLIDDVHLLAGKDHTQDEFLHTFNAMSVAGKQVVMASDSPPNAIARLRNELVNRFVSGLVVRLDPPGFETRCRILEHKARTWNTPIPQDVSAVLARAVHGSVRELEGALVRLVAHARLLKEPLSVGLAARVANDLSEERKPVGLTEVANEVAVAFGVSVAELNSRRRTRRVTEPRHVAMYLARKLTNHSLSEVGEFLGGRNHVSVIHGVKQVKKKIAENDELRVRVEQIRARLDPQA